MNNDIKKASQVVVIMKIISVVMFCIALIILISRIVKLTNNDSLYSSCPILANKEDISKAMSDSDPKLYWIQNQYLEGTEIEDDKDVLRGRYLYISRLAYTCSKESESIGHSHHTSGNEFYEWDRTPEEDSYNVSKDGISLFGNPVILSPETVYYSADESYNDPEGTYYYPLGTTKEYTGNIKQKYHVISSSDMITMLALVGNNRIVQQSVENDFFGSHDIFCNTTVADVLSAAKSESITGSVWMFVVFTFMGLVILFMSKQFKIGIDLAIEKENTLP